MSQKTQVIEKRVYIVDGVRTPFGSFGGGLKDLSPVELGLLSSKELLSRVGVAANKLDHVILGNVAPSTTDTLYGARHVALKLGCPESTPAYNVNRLCGSGIQSITDAVRLIRLGEASCILSLGSENMSMMPQLVYGSRFGTKYGALKTDDMLLSTLTDKFTQLPMGITAESLAEDYKISRQECEDFSLNSHLKAHKSYEILQKQIFPIQTKRGSISTDEHLREDMDLESLSKLKPSFKQGGVVTPATASGIVDGACSILIADEDFINKNNLKPLAEVVDFNVIGVDPKKMGIGPVPSILNLLSKNDIRKEDISFFEINEAFASQVLACQKSLDIPSEKLNVWGGAIGIGHPLGATGNRIALNAALQLSEYGGTFSVASACIGGGQGISILLKQV